VLDMLREYEHVNQLRTTFVQAPVHDGRIFTSYGLHRTANGQLASGAEKESGTGADTNAQNWHKSVRDIIIPDDGNTFVAGDWKQLHWLIALLFAEDDAGFDRCTSGEDTHRNMAGAGLRNYICGSDARAAQLRQAWNLRNYLWHGCDQTGAGVWY